MKFKYILVVFIMSFLMISCNAPEDTGMNTDESSIFEVSDVQHIKITSDSCDVKAGVGDNFKKIDKLNKNEIVNVLRQVDDWYVVQLDNNEIGAVQGSDAKPVVIEDEGNDNVQQQPKDDVPEGQRPESSETPQNQDIPQTPGEGTNDQANNNQAPKNQNTQENDGNIAALTNSEQQMLNLVNQERQKNNLPKLKADLEVTKVARVKSQDMVDNNYFSHYSPNYGSPFEMMKSFGIDYLHAGENLAGNSTVQKAHTALMNSSGHRKNILSPDFTHIGIGIKPSDKYGYMFTQMFISKPK
ncbi:SCP-like extracellular protein [Clostridium sp. D2Q-11]|uniref:SCP-like extracellular protein n=1 Tax=Anaeromonas frigoriresistens TaxID=2683708 RepID=A0A942UVX3_9FIRM|nr:CAP domain-containing protein [Anaeromonas frigoriresistens]MBS4538495.1 SCP-like extracellular protein [Anaeromonas frigoriresistens]